jgi:hypothetical protein
MMIMMMHQHRIFVSDNYRLTANNRRNREERGQKNYTFHYPYIRMAGLCLGIPLSLIAIPKMIAWVIAQA